MGPFVESLDDVLWRAYRDSVRLEFDSYFLSQSITVDGWNYDSEADYIEDRVAYSFFNSSTARELLSYYSPQLPIKILPSPFVPAGAGSDGQSIFLDLESFFEIDLINTNGNVFKANFAPAFFHELAHIALQDNDDPTPSGSFTIGFDYYGAQVRFENEVAEQLGLPIRAGYWAIGDFTGRQQQWTNNEPIDRAIVHFPALGSDLLIPEDDQPKSDLIIGSDGSEEIGGGASRDFLYGEGGDDILLGGSGHDDIYAGLRNDTDQDRLFGGTGADFLVGNGGSDLLDGGAGPDILQYMGGDTQLRGGEGNDYFDLSKYQFQVGDVARFIFEDNFGRDVLSNSRSLSGSLIMAPQDQIQLRFPNISSNSAQIVWQNEPQIVQQEGIVFTRDYDGSAALIIGDNSIYIDSLFLSAVLDEEMNYEAIDWNESFQIDWDVELVFSDRTLFLSELLPQDIILESNIWKASFTSALNDHESDRATPENRANIGGTDLSDMITGTDGSDVITALSGDDIIVPGGGNDTIDGGEGRDKINYSGISNSVTVSLFDSTTTKGTLGRDTLLSIEDVTGTSKSDTITGNHLSNRLSGGSGGDVINGGAGDDELLGQNGADMLAGGGGADTLKGHSGGDTLSGGDGNDKLNGGGGNDTLAGGNGDDELIGGEGHDSLSGGAGDDQLFGDEGNDILFSSAGSDEYNGGGGVDIFDASSSWALTINLSTGSGWGASSGDTYTISSIEEILGGAGDDTFWSAATGSVLSGGLGADTLNGGDGADTLQGDAGDDTISPGRGSDVLTGGAGNDTLRGTAAAFDGDIITDLSAHDRIVFENTNFQLSDISGAGSALQLSIDTDGNGAVDTNLTLENLSAAHLSDLIVTSDGVDTVITLRERFGFTINGKNTNDTIGYHMSSAGDFSGDGIDDFLLSSSVADPAGKNRAGEAYVIFGRDSSVGAVFDPIIELTTLDGTNGFVIPGLNASDALGSAIASLGDINGDGLADIVVGALGVDVNGANGAGTSYILFGRDTSVQPGFSPSFDVTTLDGTNGFIVEGIDPNDLIGDAVSSAGDLNGDGVGDILIGDDGLMVDGKFSAGGGYILFGRDTSTGPSFGPTVDLTTLNGTEGFTIRGVDAYDWAGGEVASAGDVNGDGIDDVLIGAGGADPGGQRFGGETYVLFGRDASAGESFGTAVDLGGLDGTDGFVITGSYRNHWIGKTIASAGDINGDGVDDILLASDRAKLEDPNYPEDPFVDTGAAYVIYGRDSAAGFSFAASLNVDSLDGTNGFAIHGMNEYDRIGGSASSVGDVNGDGIDDILIGADEASSPGESYLIFGRDGASGSAFSAQFDLTALDGTNGYVLTGIDFQDYSGAGVAGAGDINGDGTDDFLIGAPAADPNAKQWAGEVYAVFGGSAALATYDALDGNQDGSIELSLLS